MHQRHVSRDARRAREFELFVAGAAGRLLHAATLLTAEPPDDNPRAQRLLVSALAHTYAAWDGLRGEDPYARARQQLAVRFARGTGWSGLRQGWTGLRRGWSALQGARGHTGGGPGASGTADVGPAGDGGTDDAPAAGVDGATPRHGTSGGTGRSGAGRSEGVPTRRTEGAPTRRTDGAPTGRTDGARSEGVLHDLTPQQRLVLVLRLYEGVAEEQTAALLGLSVERVHTICARAVSNLLHPPSERTASLPKVVPS